MGKILVIEIDNCLECFHSIQIKEKLRCVHKSNPHNTWRDFSTIPLTCPLNDNNGLVQMNERIEEQDKYFLEELKEINIMSSDLNSKVQNLIKKR